MSDGVGRATFTALRARLMSVNGIVATAGFATLIIGFFLGSPVGRIICGTIFLGAGAYLYASWKKKGRAILWFGDEEDKEDLYSQPPEGHMKKLLFDDFQSSGPQYVVKEIQEEESVVVPSTKTAQPVALVTQEEKQREFEIGDFFDLNSDILRSDAEPRSEFNFLLGKVLLALKEVLFAHSVAFFWANREKQQLVLEALATDSQCFVAEKRMDIGGDVVSQVATTGKPQMLGRVNPVSEKEIIHYYESPEYIKSFVGVPVYFLNGAKEGEPVAVIIADSKAEDAFGAETFDLLGNFTKLVSALIKSYTQKYDLLLDSELLTSIRRMHDRIRSDVRESTIINCVAEEASRLVNWDHLTITMYAEDRRGWMVQKVVNRSGGQYVSQGDMVDFHEGIVGRAIMTNHLESIDDVGTDAQIRFHSLEKIEVHGSFLCVPISSINRCYGALTLESKNTSNFAGIEVETIYRLVESAASVLEVLYMNDLVKDFVVVDQLTGSFTKKHFMKKLEEEVVRSEDFGTELAYVSIAVDGMQAHVNRYGREGFDTILTQVAKIVKGNTRLYDVIGRMEADRLGVLLVNTAASEGYLWAEKIRKQISSYIITLETSTLSVTVSAGVCGLTEGMDKEQLVAGTLQVLDKAMEDGGNLVRVF
ncbi:MAG: diguanylate cyclase [Bacteroidota bacterium]